MNLGTSLAKAASDTFDLDGLKFSDAVASGRIRLHAPPAADERWRRLHARKGHTDVQQRWLQDSRHFALYYQREGTAKEQLHHIPKNFTAKTVNGDLEPRTRHWLLGSGYLQDLDEDGRWAASAKPHVTPHGAGPDAGAGLAKTTGHTPALAPRPAEDTAGSPRSELVLDFSAESAIVGRG